MSQIQKCLPYLRHISETIWRILTPLEICTCFKPHQTLRQLLVHPKDPNSPHTEAKRCVQVPCASCPDVYTGCTLEHRLKQHKRKFRHYHLLCSCWHHTVMWVKYNSRSACRLWVTDLKYKTTLFQLMLTLRGWNKFEVWVYTVS